TSLPLEEEQLMNTYNPVGKTNCESPVLLMHGDSDTTVSIRGQEDYFHYLTETGGRDNVTLIIYENNNHIFSSEMVKDLLEWLRK
ncbi:MAG: prolyl oligopeptidase family serine peptidase, partial [Paenisporosarcina sp.]